MLSQTVVCSPALSLPVASLPVLRHVLAECALVLLAILFRHHPRHRCHHHCPRRCHLLFCHSPHH